MTGAITWELVMSIGAAIGISFAIWWRIEGKVDKAKTEVSEKAGSATLEAKFAREELAAYKVHVAETFATKQSMTEGFAAVTKSVNDVGARVEHRIDGMNERLDRVIEANHKPVRRQGS